MKRLRSSIRARLTVATLLPLITAIGICWLVGISIITTRFAVQAQQSVETNLNSAHEIYLGELARLSDIIRLTGQSAAFSAVLDSPGKPAADLPLQLTLHNERLSFLTLVDRYGFVRYRAGNPGMTGDSQKGEKLISDALKGVVTSGIMLLSEEQAVRENSQLPQKIAITIKATPHARPYFRKIENRGMFLVAAAPILAADGRVAGVLYGGILLNGDNRLIDRITRVVFRQSESGDAERENGTATLFLEDARIATSVLDENRQRAIGSLMSTEVYNAVSRGETWFGKAFVLDKQNFTAYEPLRDYRGSVIGALYVGTPERPYLQLRSRFNLIFSGVLVFVTLIGIGLSAWLSRRLSSPVKALEEEVRRIAAGEKLPDISVESDDEIGSLANEFNIMKHRLAAREVENLALNRTLEDKVVERTAQLEEKNQLLLNVQKDLAQAERLAGIGLLASGVAHEINNPLAIIRGNAELLEMSARLDDSHQSEVETIIQQVGRVERIVSNLLTFARTQKKIIRPFRIEALLDDILNQIGHQIALDTYRIERRYQTAGAEIEGDEDQLRQVFTNLIVNGLQDMEHGGVLRVGTEVRAGDELCRITIADSGTGISKELQEKLFTPFFTTKERGTGLGLAVSYGIVKDHGGDIRVVSAPGLGAEFIVVLPVRQPPGRGVADG
jgi:two-component system NtrC family sensor kinase